MGEISFKENELYQEIELFVDGEKIGEAEVEIKGKMLSRLSIFPPYQDKDMEPRLYQCSMRSTDAMYCGSMRTMQERYTPMRRTAMQYLSQQCI